MSDDSETNTPILPPIVTMQTQGESEAEGQVKLLRARNYFLALARRVEMSPDDAQVLSMMLGDRIAEYWEQALEASMQASESLDDFDVHPIIDATIAKSLQEHPDLQLVTELYNRLPRDTVLLKQTSLEVFRQVVRAMETRNRVHLHPAEYIIMLHNYTHRLMQVEQVTEAETESNKAMALAREHYAHDPQGFHNTLIDSLEVEADIAFALGRYEESREARAEAIRLLRATPGRERTLAQCLNNQSRTVRSLGDTSSALEHSEAAVQIYRSLVSEGETGANADYSAGLQAWVDDSYAALGDGLITLSSHQLEAGRFEEALLSAQESVDIFGELGDDFRDQFWPRYGMARHNLGLAKFSVGDLAGELVEMQEAANVYRRLATAHSGAYLPAYVLIQGSFALALARNDRLPEGLAQQEECVDAYRKLEQADPGRFVEQLKTALFNLAILYEEVGRLEDASDTRSERVQLDTRAASD